MEKRILPIGCIAAVAFVVSGCGIDENVHKKALDELAQCQKRAEACEATMDKSKAQLQEQLTQSNAEREKFEAQLASIGTNLESTKSELEELHVQRSAAEQRLASYRQLNDRLRSFVDTGKLNVAYRRGQMVVGLPAEILFASGRSRLSRKGRDALKGVAQVLLGFKDRRFIIGGHTDNAKLKSKNKRYSNWNLSTDRAVSVVNFFVSEGFDPKNLAAAGYGEFDPVGDNTTEEGRTQNRRLEIVLVPDLSELPSLASGPEAAAKAKAEAAAKNAANAKPAEESPAEEPKAQPPPETKTE